MKYEIIGEPFPALACELEDGESLINQSGAMAWMSPNMEMETTSKGGFGAMMGRIFSGDSMMLVRYKANGKGSISYATSFPGSILELKIDAQHEYLIQNHGFLCAEEGVNMNAKAQKLSVGLFGEGLVMQRLSGNGLAFVEVDGYLIEKELAPGEQVIVNTGFLAAAEGSCTLDVKSVKGVKNVLFGGHGLFHTIVTGPGKVYIQTKPASKMANALKSYLPSSSSGSSSGSSSSSSN